MSGRWGLVVRGLVVVVIVAGVAGYIAMHHETNRLESSEAAGTSATNAVRTTMPKMLGYTAGTLPGELKENRKLLTSKYGPRYEAMVRSRVLPTATKFGVANTVTVVSTAVVRATPDRAVILVFANQTTRTRARPQGVTQGTRLQVSLERQHETWLVDGIRPL